LPGEHTDLAFHATGELTDALYFVRFLRKKPENLSLTFFKRIVAMLDLVQHLLPAGRQTFCLFGEIPARSDERT